MGGFSPNTIKLGPPFTITQEEIDTATDALDAALTVAALPAAHAAQPIASHLDADVDQVPGPARLLLGGAELEHQLQLAG